MRRLRLEFAAHQASPQPIASHLRPATERADKRGSGLHLCILRCLTAREDPAAVMTTIGAGNRSMPPGPRIAPAGTNRRMPGEVLRSCRCLRAAMNLLMSGLRPTSILPDHPG